MPDISILPEGFMLGFVFFFGLCLGSFVTAWSWRLPRGISLLDYDGSKRSLCPTCKTSLGLLDLLPVFSWLLSKGKCRHCATKIGMRYPLTELGTAALCTVFYLFVPDVKQSLPLIALFMALSTILMTIVVIDLEHKIIPNILNLSIGLLGGAFLLLTHFKMELPLSDIWPPVQAALFSMVVYCGFSVLLRAVFLFVTKKDPLGFGDIKFFAAAGVWLNIQTLPLFLILSGATGVLLGLVWQYITKEKTFPFGPALILAFVLSVCLPEKILYEFL